MRILLLNYEFPPLGGGASNASLQVARTLVLHGHEVDVVTSRMRGLPLQETVEGARVFRVMSWRRGIQDAGLIGAITYLVSARAACRRLLRERAYDVVHYFFGLPTGALSLIVPELEQTPAVVSLRGSDVPGYDEAPRNLRWLHRLLAPATRTIWNRSAKVIANSDGLRRLAQGFLPEKPLGMIPNAVRSDLFKPLPHSAESSRRRVNVLCVARLVVRKGLDDLLQALALAGDCDLSLTLQGAGPEAQALERLAHSLGIADRVHFNGYRPQPELPDVYAQADIFVLPSHTESCSMALLEAMSCGLPVVASQIGGNPELIEEGRGGLLVPIRSPRDLATALSTLAADPLLRARMGAYNRARIEASYSWDVVARRYLEAYEEAIATRAPRGDA